MLTLTNHFWRLALGSLIRRFNGATRCLVTLLRSPSPAGASRLAKRGRLDSFSLREKVAAGRMRVNHTNTSLAQAHRAIVASLDESLHPVGQPLAVGAQEHSGGVCRHIAGWRLPLGQGGWRVFRLSERVRGAARQLQEPGRIALSVVPDGAVEWALPGSRPAVVS